ncbi:DNA methyltransferase [Corynebacterium pilosum]|uniref:site-specific DNA-methyltransferase (adenine-specific) n=1 Tax=Corynebacterium pilosum TaxID=35756 RepID=A0A376CM85_9CORY|nr:DNA methyltransferase [Corynebacterium pilosum]STC69317.1 putative adenine-specific methylase [Corynebacterium pilosum]
MARLSLKDIEARIEPLGGRDSYDREIIFELLDAYGKPKSSITRLRNGSINIAEDPEHEIGQKNVVYFRELTAGEEPFKVISELAQSAHVRRFSPRFVIVSDYSEFVALDTKTNENRVFPVAELPQHFTFFLPWAGMEKAQYVAESHADVKAAERMGKLFDELLSANPGLFDSENDRHGLNVFFTRLLFCYFAEDTGIFADGQFTNAVASHTHDDGSDVQEFLADLFAALDEDKADSKPSYLADFPYVNGRLFSTEASLVVPKFSGVARTQLIELGTLMWQDINPDIFGSMFQVIVTPGKRSDLGQHYTSVPNILKTIEPLFLDKLKEEFDQAFDSVPKLEKLHDRIADIKVFDPACGSGNFLVIAYKELRKLEHAIMERILELSNNYVLFDESRINIEHFYGIEIDDFAVEIAILSLWISKHQMNVEFEEKFKTSQSIIPLKETGQIRAGNAARVQWESVCPNNGTDEIYIIGNPPYGGSKKQTKEQKADYEFVFVDEKYSKNLDYIALWFIKGARYIQGTRAELALVSTNSVSQGEHVGLMFPKILDLGVEIGFAYTSFKWENNAKNNAGVTVVVIGLRNKSDKPKYIYQDEISKEAKNINGYLADGPDVFVTRSSQNRNTNLPKMSFGSMPIGKPLTLTHEDYANLVGEYPEANAFTRKFTGSEEFIYDKIRYCLWIEDSDVSAALQIEPIRRRVDAVEQFRSESGRKDTNKLAATPYKFGEIRYKPTDSIIVPSVSSENREYIPMGYLDSDTVISNLAFAVYDAEPWLFALLTSRMHMVWTGAVGGKMETRYRYSNTIVYNNFPVPELSEADKEELTQAALRVLDVREYYSEKTLAVLYDRKKIPEMLREAHGVVDKLVDNLYSKQAFDNDEARLSHLFAMYKEQTATTPAKKAKK